MAEQKLSGVEMMLQSLMRAAGFDPGEIERNIVSTVQQFQTSLTLLTSELRSIREEQAMIAARLERIEIHLGIGKAGAYDGEAKRIAHAEG